MMRTLLLTAAIAALSASTLSAQAPQTLTITGCLKPENAVAGMKPDELERMGTNLDFILTDVKMSPSSNVSGIALADKYEIEGVKWSELLKHINHQLEVTGTIAGTATKDDAADFKATSFKMLSESCEQPK